MSRQAGNAAFAAATACLRLFGVGPAAAADDLLAVRRIDRIERRRRLERFPVDDGEIGPAELRHHLSEGGIHRPPRLGSAEIRQRLHAKRRNGWRRGIVHTKRSPFG